MSKNKMGDADNVYGRLSANRTGMIDAAHTSSGPKCGEWSEPPLRLRDVETVKDTNPKDSIGSDKMPLHLWPNTATILGTLGLLDGAAKYGRSNWRAAGVRASIYYDAMRRHMDAWFEGEDYASDSGVHHLGHALACLAILVDAMSCDKLVDDRMLPGEFRAFLDRYTPDVRRIKELHAEKHPHHFTIADRK